MALLGSFTKQVREIGPVDIDYSKVIDGRTIDTLTPTVEVPTGMTLVSSAVSGTVLQLYISGGSDATSYNWTVLCDIVIGGKTTRVEDEFICVIAEV